MGRRKRKRVLRDAEKIGGLAFYLSLFSLLILSLSNSSALLIKFSLSPAPASIHLVSFLSALAVGYFLTRTLLPGRTLVFMHETKHAILAGIAGNRWKQMKVEQNSGEFEYAYTKDTAHLNALIALAPYFFPLLTIPASLTAFALFNQNHLAMTALVGAALGCDLFANFRDISPHQSDFSSIRGGFGIGLLYVVSANLFLVTMTIAWALDGTHGLQLLMAHFWDLVALIVDSLRGALGRH